MPNPHAPAPAVSRQLDVPLALPRGLKHVRLTVASTNGNKRVALRIDVTTADNVERLYGTAKCGAVVWRGVLAPALLAYCAARRVPVTLREVASQGSDTEDDVLQAYGYPPSVRQAIGPTELP